MNVLVSTQLTQGQRQNDFCWVEDGELVMFTFVCDGETVDGPCGCARSMAGVVSHKSTTTMEVVDQPDMTVEELARLLKESRDDSWGAGVFQDEDLMADAEELTRIAAAFIPGEVLERRGTVFRPREVQP